MGLRALGERVPVLGNCVRRDAVSQGARVAQVASALAGLIVHVRSGRIAAGSRVLFVHTGGQPALFAYAESLGPWLSEAPEERAR